MSGYSRAYSLGLLLLVIFQLVYYFPILCGGREYFVSDHTFFFEPLTRFIAEAWKEGRLPLWNPYCYCGMSEIANPSPGLFYFPNYLFACFSYSKALVLVQCVHEVAAYTAGFLLCLLFGLEAPAGVVAGLTLAANGYFLTLPSNYTLPGTFAWGALGLCFLLAIALRPLPATIAAALTVHWMLVAGRPEVYVPWFLTYGLLMLLMLAGRIHLGYSYFGKARAGDVYLEHFSPKKVLFLQCLALGTALLLSMLAMMPVYEWTKLSSRSTGLDTVQIFYWSSNWYDFLGMILCKPLGDLQQPGAYLSGLVASRSGYYPFLPSAYVGPVVLTLAIFGCFDQRLRNRFYFLGAGVAAAFISMGQYSPVAPALIKYVPFFAVLRYPCKVLIFLVLFLALLAGGGLRYVLSGRAGTNSKMLCLGFWSVATITGAVFCGYPTIAYFFDGNADLLRMLGRPLLCMSFIGAVTTLVIISARPLKLKKGLVLMLIAAFAAGFFVPLAQHRQRTVAEGYYAKPSGLAAKLDEIIAARDPRGELNLGASLKPRLLTLYADPLRLHKKYSSRPNVVAGENFMQYSRELLMPETNIDQHWPTSFGYEAGETKDYSTFYLTAFKSSRAYRKEGRDKPLWHFARLTSTRYVGSHIENSKGPVGTLDAALFKVVCEEPVLNLRLYEVVDALPRAFLSAEFREVPKDIFIEELLSDNWDSSTVAIEPLGKWEPLNDYDKRPQHEGHISVPVSDMKMATDGPASADGSMAKDGPVSAEALNLALDQLRFLQDNPEHVALSVKTSRPQFLVLNDKYYPGWQAMVDSQPVTLFRANGFMRGVYLTAGSHLVEFDFKPESLAQGANMALGGLVILILLMLMALAGPTARVFHFLTTGSWERRKS